jgi:hypothetical protein
MTVIATDSMNQAPSVMIMRHRGLYSMSSPALIGSLFMATLLALVTPRQQRGPHIDAASLLPSSGRLIPAPMQEVSAYLKVRDAGNAIWPNNGDVPVIAFGWGGDRPLPNRLRADSLNPIFAKPLRSPTLNFQKRDDIFSPILRRLAGQDETIPMMSFTINTWRGGPITYNMYDVKVISMRDVGQVIEENPVTQEVVLAFSRIEQEPNP